MSYRELHRTLSPAHPAGWSLVDQVTMTGPARDTVTIGVEHHPTGVPDEPPTELRRLTRAFTANEVKIGKALVPVHAGTDGNTPMWVVTADLDRHRRLVAQAPLHGAVTDPHTVSLLTLVGSTVTSGAYPARSHGPLVRPLHRSVMPIVPTGWTATDTVIVRSPEGVNVIVTTQSGVGDAVHDLENSRPRRLQLKGYRQLATGTATLPGGESAAWERYVRRSPKGELTHVELYAPVARATALVATATAPSGTWARWREALFDVTTSVLFTPP